MTSEAFINEVQVVLENIAVRGEDDGERFTDTARVDAISHCLKESQWHLYYDGKLAKVYAHGDLKPAKPVVVVSSHVDMVATRCYANCAGQTWTGSFDNLITNAIAVACMRKGLFSPNTLVAFTGDEEAEDGFGGADEVAELIDRRGIDVKIVAVTDVTYEGWKNGKTFTIENVFPEDDEKARRGMVAELKSAVADVDADPCVIEDGAPDEAWEYDEFELPCCTVCMPCAGDMHSEEGVVIRSAAVCPYSQALAAIAAASENSARKSECML